MRHRVVAYITRLEAGRRQLLVFTHRDYPEAGVQVPGGGVEVGETTEEALFREVWEESGLAGLRLVGKLAEEADPERGQAYHVFHLVAPDGLPAAWDHVTNDYHDDEHRARDERLVFCYHWVDLDRAAHLLGLQGRWVHLVADGPA